MRLLRTGFISLLLLYFCITAAYAGSQQEEATFNWSMALQNTGSSAMVPFTAPVRSSNGESFRFLIQSDINSFCYIIAEDSSGEMVVFFSGRLTEGVMWTSPVFQLVPPAGRENFYIIVSKNEQQSLAQRIASFNANPSVMNTRALMNEIDSLRALVSQFRETPEVPVLMGGTSRSGEADLQGTSFSGLSTYVKTVSIDH